MSFRSSKGDPTFSWGDATFNIFDLGVRAGKRLGIPELRYDITHDMAMSDITRTLESVF
jgi:hypothetical protein